MGVDPIDQFVTPDNQEQIVKLFRFGTQQEIDLFEQSATIFKSKSEREHSTNQRLTHQADRRKLKRIRKGIASLEKQSNNLNVKKGKISISNKIH